MDYIIEDLLSNNGRVSFTHITQSDKGLASLAKRCAAEFAALRVTKPPGAESMRARLCTFNDLLDGHWCCTML